MQFKQTVKAEQNGLRVDQFIAQESGMSRNQLATTLKSGRVLVNGKPIKKTLKLKEGDIVSTPLLKAEKPKMKASTMDLDILYENEEYMVINKPAGVVVHPDSTGHHEDTIANAVMAHLKIKPKEGDLRPGIVHRLDKDTSGALAVAKTPEALTRLSKLFFDHKVQKTYLALVKGTPRTDTGRIEAAIRRSSKDRQQMAIHSQGRAAITTFEVESTWGWCTLLKVKIETGRTHQIRLHLASIGLPILGDTVYGDSVANAQARTKLGLRRQWLHAWKLALDNQEFVAPLPPDLLKALPTAIDL